MSEKQVKKSPVVVILGHVDHGKTAILDFIRKTNVVEKESGGITQHIGAYEVEHSLAGSEQAQKITFIDTPGHEAFSAMRSRGAKVADIAVLVIDAVEGVRTQTKEAINSVRKAGIPMIVALNKIDKPQAQVEKVKGELAKNDISVESMGGKIPSVNVSAKTGQGINELLEHILLVAEVEELKTDVSGPGEGTIIESYLDAQKGPVATLLLSQGTLKENDILATRSALGKVKSLTDFQGKLIKSAQPSQPVSVLGFEKAPGVGEKFKVYQNQEEARHSLKKEEIVGPQVISLDPGQKILNIILKSDVLGSGEAIEGVLKNLPQEKVILRILKTEVGNISVGDVKLAESGKAMIFGFRVKIAENAKSFARLRKIRWKIFEIIYELIQEMRREMMKTEELEIERIDLGKVKILILFKRDKEGQVIGGKVIEGEVERNGRAEVLRGEEIIGEGRIKNLQQEKKDIQKIGKGKECGIFFQGETEVEEGDILQVFREEKKRREL